MSLLAALDGRHGDHADAVRIGDDRMSWASLAAAASALGTEIAGRPVFPVRATPTMETVVSVVAGILAGVPVVPIAADAGPEETAYVLADSAASGVPDDVILILYTSGTTGRPKGVPITRSAVAAGLDGLAEAWAWTPDDRLVHGLPLYHVHGLVLGVLGALRVGCRLTHTVKPDPLLYAEAAGSLYFGVPTVWSRVCAVPEAARALASARLLVSGSAPLPEPVFEGLTSLTGMRPIERYGMTETLITVTTRHDGERRPGSVGHPIAGVSTRLGPVSSDDFEGGDGLGELLVSGPTVFGGYLGRPEATAASFTADGWFRTGDIATIADDGTHRIVGRASVDLIKTGGYRVGAGEVEDALLAHPAVREAAVVGVPHADLGQEIVAYVVADKISATDLVAFAAARLSWHKRPRRVVFVGALPRNAMGKVQKKQLG